MAEEASVRTATVELPGGRELRARLWLDPEGGTSAVLLSTGWPEAGPLDPAADRLWFPADALPDVLEALGELAEGEAQP